MKPNDLLPIPINRKMPADPWRPPAGVRFISTDDHNMEPEHLWDQTDRTKARHPWGFFMCHRQTSAPP